MIKGHKNAQHESVMTHLKAGNMVFHNGVPVQLLYRVTVSRSGETWRVRPLFVEAPDREDRFIRSDRISFLHTMRAHCSEASRAHRAASL
jgi:hypothetical protein